MLTAISCLVKTKGNQTISALAKVSEHHTTIQLHPVSAAGVLLLPGGNHVHKPYQSSTEIRHSSPDTHTESCSFHWGKESSHPPFLLCWDTPLLLKQRETPGSAPGTRLQRQRGAG